MTHRTVRVVSFVALCMACGSESPSYDGKPGAGATTSSTSGGSAGTTGSSGASAAASTTGSGGVAGAGGAAVATGGSGGSPGAGGVSGSTGAAGTTGSGGMDAGLGGAGGKGAGGGKAGSDAGAMGGGSFDAGPRSDATATGIAARNVTLSVVEANQSTAVALLKMGAAVPVASRNAELIEGRPMLVRAHVDVATGWMARPILGVLTLGYEGGASVQRTESKTIAADSNVDQLNTTFNFLLDAAEVKPGMQIAVELQEATQQATPEPATPPRFPATGLVDLGVKAGPMELKVVIIPAQTSGGFPQSTEERRKVLYNHLFDIYPVQKVTIDWREPKMLAQQTSSSAAFTLLRDQCNADGAAANVLYHMVIRGNDSGFTFAGVATGSNSSATQKCRGVSLTVVRNAAGGMVSYIDGNVNTTAHELGHNHGASHIACGGASGVDPAFPYMNGFLGAQGYSLSENALKTTTQFKELMGYCRPRWISDWMWNKFATRVRLMTGFAPFEEPATEHSLSGFVEANGTSNWSVVPGGLTEPGEKVSATRFAKVWLPGGVQTVPVSVIPTSEPELVEVVATLPNGPLPSRATVTLDGREHVIDFGAIQKH